MSEFKTLREKIAAEKAERTERYNRFAALWSAAWERGMVAANTTTPRTMLVQNIDGTIADVVPEGPCGFAWIKVPGNTSFGKWLAKTHGARKSYYGGLEYSIQAYSQSYDRKSAHARAMAAYLVDNGIECYAGGRLD